MELTAYWADRLLRVLTTTRSTSHRRAGRFLGLPGVRHTISTAAGPGILKCKMQLPSSPIRGNTLYGSRTARVSSDRLAARRPAMWGDRTGRGPTTLISQLTRVPGPAYSAITSCRRTVETEAILSIKCNRVQAPLARLAQRNQPFRKAHRRPSPKHLPGTLPGSIPTTHRTAAPTFLL